MKPANSYVACKRLETAIENALMRPSGGIHVLAAPPGSGKSTAARHVIRRLQEQKKLAGKVFNNPIWKIDLDFGWKGVHGINSLPCSRASNNHCTTQPAYTQHNTRCSDCPLAQCSERGMNLKKSTFVFSSQCEPQPYFIVSFSNLCIVAMSFPFDCSTSTSLF